MTPTIEDRADTIARGVWEAMASTQTLTLSSVRDAVFKELAADEVRRASRAEVEREKAKPAGALAYMGVDLGKGLDLIPVPADDYDFASSEQMHPDFTTVMPALRDGVWTCACPLCTAENRQ